MNLRKQLFHAFIATVCLVAISGSASAQSDETQNRLNKNRRKWTEKSIKSYQYDFQRICFCLASYTKRMKITVREGVTESIQHADTGDAVDKSKFDLYYTVEGLFDYIQAAIDKKAYSIRVVYDADLGYPTAIDVDYIKNAIDDEIRFKTGKLVAEKISPKKISPSS